MAGFAGYVGAIQKILGGVFGTAEVGMGLRDMWRGKKKRKAAAEFWEENKYKIPEGARGALASAERQASGFRLPGEDLRREQLQGVTSQTVGSAQQVGTSSSDVLATLANIGQMQMQAEQGMAIEGAQRYDVNQAVLRDELGRMAGYEEERFRFNQLLPYMQMLEQAQVYSNRGAQMISNGIGTIGGVAASSIQEYGAQNNLNQMMQQYGLNNQGGNTTQQQWSNYQAQDRNQFGRTAQQESAMQDIAGSAFK